MACILKELKGEVQYRDRRFDGTDEEYFKALSKSNTVYVGNLAFSTREEQLYEVFSKVGPVERVYMGLNQQTKTPCGFAFVIFHSHKVAQAAVSYISGTKVDNRYIRVDMDWGFQEGRQYGRGKTGGQVRDEFRQEFDAGRVDPMMATYNEGMGPSGGARPNLKRPRYHDNLPQGRRTSAPELRRAKWEDGASGEGEDAPAGPPAPPPPPPEEVPDQEVVAGSENADDVPKDEPMDAS